MRPEPLQGLFLTAQGSFELRFGHLSPLEQNETDHVLGVLVESRCTDDAPVLEGHRDQVLLGTKSQHTRLPLQRDQLQDIGERKVTKSSFERHPTSGSTRRCLTARQSTRRAPENTVWTG